MSNDRTAGYKLVETGTLVEFEVTDSDVEPAPDGEMHFDADYLRGRCVKTEIVVRRDGRITLQTRGRGESAPQDRSCGPAR